mgnify:CR=1 FL=1
MVLFENVHIFNCRSETRSAFALSPLVMIWGRTAVSDALLTGLVAVSMLLIWQTYADPGGPRWAGWVVLGLAVLTKGPVAIALLLLTLMFRVLESLLSLDSIYTLTLGGPGYATFTMTYYIYTLGLRSFNLGMAAATSWLFMIFAASMLILVFWLQRRTQTAQ